MLKAKRKSFKGKQTREQTTNGVNENEMESEQQSINTKDAMLAEMRQAGSIVSKAPKRSVLCRSSVLFNTCLYSRLFPLLFSSIHKNLV